MKRTLNIGLIRTPGRQRRQRLTVTVELMDTERGTVLSITGGIGKLKFGQVHDSIVNNIQSIEYSEGWNKYRLFKLLEVWEHWNLNDMCAGTPAQTEVLRPWFKNRAYPDNGYLAQCAELNRHGLLVDNGHRYGTAWLFRPLPVSIEAEMRDLIGQQ